MGILSLQFMCANAIACGLFRMSRNTLIHIPNKHPHSQFYKEIRLNTEPKMATTTTPKIGFIVVKGKFHLEQKINFVMVGELKGWKQISV